MKTPKGLEPLIDDGIIDAVLRPLKSGKEASVYLVSSRGTLRCAKVYKDAEQRSFQKRSIYEEGRKQRGSREARAIGKGSRHGRREQESAWKNAEVAALYRLNEAGVRVPRPYGFFDGVLLMELISDADGNPAPRLNEVELDPDLARSYHRFLINQVVRMLCAGLVHGDLSEFNVLVDPTGPVIIDLPQATEASSNNNALQMLERDVSNLALCLGRFAPELLTTRYAAEIWDHYQRGELTPETPLTGDFADTRPPADLEGVLEQIEAARDEAWRRELGRQRAADLDG